MGDWVVAANLLQVYPRSEGGPPKAEPEGGGWKAGIHPSFVMLANIYQVLALCQAILGTGKLGVTKKEVSVGLTYTLVE